MRKGVFGWIAVLLLASGVLVALLPGARVTGALVFSLGAVVLGAGSLAEDRAVGLVMILVGVGAIVGVLGHIVTSVGP